MPPESKSCQALVYLEYDEGCSKEVAHAIVQAAASVYGITAEILPTDSEKDLQDIYSRIYGSKSEPKEASDKPVVISVFRVVDMARTIVAQTGLIGGDYELFAEKLFNLKRTTLSLSRDLD